MTERRDCPAVAMEEREVRDEADQMKQAPRSRPTGQAESAKEKSDGQVIRTEAVRAGVELVTSISVAKELVDKLAKATVKK